MLQNYLSIEILINFLSTFFVKKTKFSSIFFYLKFEMEVYWSFFWSKTGDIRFLHILEGISAKSYHLKKSKMGLIELSEIHSMNKK